MSLETVNSKKQYNLAAPVPASFPFDFTFWDPDEIYAVISTPSGNIELVQGVDYSVSSPDDSGTVTRLTDWDATATLLTIYRELEITQPVDLANGAGLDADVVELMHDRAVAMIQQQREVVGRIVRFPISDTTTSADLPGSAERANHLLAFDDEGNPIPAEGVASVPVSEFMAPVVEALSEAAAEKALGLLSAEAAQALPHLDKALPYLPAGPFERAVRAPASYDPNALLDSGWYAWASALTVHYPGSCSAADLFVLAVAAANIGSGAILQRLWDLTLGPSSPYFEWTRFSLDGGATWSSWRALDPRISLVSWITETIVSTAIPIGMVYFQGPHDSAPASIWGGTWEDVSHEEANLARRAVGVLAGAFFAGTPARLSVSVASGVPSISIVSGGSGYMGGGSGNINLIIAGGCTTQMVANATVTSGVLTAINVTTAGAGYTSGALAVYDGVVGHGDLIQGHWQKVRGDSNEGSGNATSLSAASAVTARGSYDYESGTHVTSPSTDFSNGVPRVGAETSGPWISVKKWRKTA
ncbi:MAG TPA: hypothetical protein PLB91_06915 [Spirochaetales bacterium]|nr:hypothetical protein [Spirochaetales bacterium]HRY52993.1 hypothetical protein [Spirochaetia bacterium]